MKLKALTAALAVLATSSVFAAQDKPAACPDVSAFLSTGVSSAYPQQDNGSRWVGIQWNNTFGTDNEWTFAIGEFDAKNASDALAQANRAISTVSYATGPDQFMQNVWMCLYTSPDQKVFAAAFTPAFNQDDMKLVKRALHR